MTQITQDDAARIASLETVKVRAKRLDKKAAEAKRNAAAKAREAKAQAKADAAKAKADAAEAKRIAKLPIHVLRNNVVDAAGASSRSLVDYTRKLGELYGADFYTVPLTGKDRGANVVARANPIAAERKALIEALTSEASNAKGYVYWKRVIQDYAPRFDAKAKPSNADAGRAKKTTLEATRSTLEDAWKRMNKSAEFTDDNAKLQEINRHLEMALKLAGADLAALKRKYEI
jgi:hypothetical protein